MESVATQAAVEVALVMVGALFALLAAVHFIEWAKNRRVKQPARISDRIPEREMQLVGDDYRECVASYFGKVERRRQIVKEVCGERH